MRRADRLFRIVQLLRRRRTIVTAAQIAEELEISERTVYRDIRGSDPGRDADRRRSGRRLSPAAWLRSAAADVRQRRDPGAGARRADRRAVRRSPRSRARASRSSARWPACCRRSRPAARRHPTVRADDASGARTSAALAVARGAGRRSGGMHLKYASERGEATERTMRPLGVFFWGKTWTLAAWCEMRTGFRNFRLDRIDAARSSSDSTTSPVVRCETCCSSMARRRQAARLGRRPRRTTERRPDQEADPTPM